MTLTDDQGVPPVIPAVPAIPALPAIDVDIDKELPVIEAEKQEARRLVESTPATMERADQVLRELQEALLL